MSKLAVIGGCGRIGLKISLVAANKGHNVTVIDIDEERTNEVKQGNLPFPLYGAEVYLEQAIKNKTLSISSENDQIRKAEIVIITIGTPVDSNLNPSLEPVAGVIFDFADHLKEKQLIIFRSTLSPAILRRIKTLIEDKTSYKVGKDIYLAFAPELSNENINIHDLSIAPQPIGTYDDESFKAASNFFQTITKGKITKLSPQEALLAKLMTNLNSYIQTAIANEFYLVAESYGANIHKILNASYNEDTSKKEQAHIPNPSANSAGPGMHKEGWFLVDRIPFSELVTTSFKINESMPSQIIKKLENYNPKKVAILGMTTRPNSDDTSSSLSYKLRKALYYKDYEVACYDPYLPEYADSSILQNADVVILMTPHNEFKDLERIRKLVNNSNCVYIDLNALWKETIEKGENGILQFQVGEKTKKEVKAKTHNRKNKNQDKKEKIG